MGSYNSDDTAAAADANLAYVQFDPTVHDTGAVEGAGTIADPNQVVLPVLTKVYKEGETLAYDVPYTDLDGNAQTLTAGDPVPDGFVFYNDEQPDGTLIETEFTADCCGCSTCVEVPVSAAPLTVTNADMAGFCGGAVTPAAFNLRAIGEGQNVPATTRYAGEVAFDGETISMKETSATNPPVNLQPTPAATVAVGDVVVFNMVQGAVDDTNRATPTIDRDPTFANNGTATVGAFTRATQEFFAYSTGDELDPGFGPWLDHEIWWAPVTAAGTMQLDATLPDRPAGTYGDLWIWNLYVVEGVDPAAPFVQTHIEPLDVIAGNLTDYAVADFDGMIDVGGSGPITATLPAAAANPVLVSYSAHRIWDRNNPFEGRDLPAYQGLLDVGGNWGGFSTEGTDGTTLFQAVAGTVTHSTGALQSGLLGDGTVTDTGAPSTNTASMWARFNVGSAAGGTLNSPGQDRHAFDAVSIHMAEFNVLSTTANSCTPGTQPTGTSIQTQTIDMVLPCARPAADTMTVSINVPRIELLAGPGTAYELQFFVNGDLAATEGIDNSLGGTVALHEITSIGHTFTCETAPQAVIDIHFACCSYADSECNFVSIDGAAATCSLSSV